jgi:hypothetical protein
MVPVVAEDPLAPCALPTADSWQWFSETGKTRATSWRNEVTLRSVEMFSEYEPVTYLPYISPTPLIILPGGHFDAYVKGFAESSGPARDWFVQHLGA